MACAAASTRCGLFSDTSGSCTFGPFQGWPETHFGSIYDVLSTLNMYGAACPWIKTPNSEASLGKGFFICFLSFFSYLTVHPKQLGTTARTGCESRNHKLTSLYNLSPKSGKWVQQNSTQEGQSKFSRALQSPTS